MYHCPGKDLEQIYDDCDDDLTNKHQLKDEVKDATTPGKSELCAPGMASAVHAQSEVRLPVLMVVWKPLCLDPSDGVFGHFGLAALCGCHTLNVCCCCCNEGQQDDGTHS